MAPSDDPYELLGVPPGATAGEIRAAYLELVARYHPDRHQGHPLADLASERLAAINGAYETLADPARRAAYDASRSAGQRAAAPRPAGTRWLLWGVLVIAGVLIVPRFARVLLAPLRGTPLLGVIFLAALAIALGFVWRRRRRPPRRGG